MTGGLILFPGYQRLPPIATVDVPGADRAARRVRGTAFRKSLAREMNYVPAVLLSFGAGWAR